MNKTLLYACITIFGAIGGYVPVLFGADGFSPWAIVISTIGSIVGIFVAKRLSDY